MTALVILAAGLSVVDAPKAALVLRDPPVPPAVALEAPAAVPTGAWVMVDGSNSSSVRPLVWIVKPPTPTPPLKLDLGDRKAVFLALKAPPAGVYAITAVAVGRDGAADPPADADTVTVIVGDPIASQPTATDRPPPSAPPRVDIKVDATSPPAPSAQSDRSAPVGGPRWAYLVDRGGFAIAQQGFDGFWAPLFREVHRKADVPRGRAVPVGFSASPEGRALFYKSRDSARALPDSVPGDRTPAVTIGRDGSPAVEVAP